MADRTGAGLAVMRINLDRFKPVNDLHGHVSGDRVLREVARRLQSATRETDTVARLGGDEFVVVQRLVNRGDESAQLAARLVAMLQNGYDVGVKSPVFLGASIGIALYPSDGLAHDSLLANADSALYRVKQSTRNAFAFFQPEKDAAQHQRFLLEQDLRYALPLQQVALVYQPQTLCQSRQAAGFEALIRWTHPTRGLVSPTEFIPLAEQSDIIIDIGAWVLRQACLEAASWDVKLRIAVNVSPRQLEHPDFPALAAATLDETGLDPHRLELEITEGLLIRDADRARKVVKKLKQIGIQMALDDFGTGFSSLGMLSSFPFDRLKLDRAFVRNLTERPQDRAIVSAVVALGHALSISVLAEGAETKEQLGILCAEGCDEVQGYILGLPASMDVYQDLTTRPDAMTALPEPVELSPA
jgi:diguanylate cyclase (GGDEF)-like protein